jgi:phosphoenolpyruvate carboxykinase (ATP)
MRVALQDKLLVPLSISDIKDIPTAMIDAIHDGALATAKTERDPVFGIDVATGCPGVPREILTLRSVWADASAYDTTARKLADLFRDNFKKYDSGVSTEITADPV